MADAGGGDADARADDAGAPGTPSWRTALTRHPTLLVVGLVALAGGIPLAVALGVLHQPRWYPILDLAQTELRIRDVGTSHTPLVGLPGRVTGNDGLQGSHPGPLSFWVLAPFYTLFGRTAFAMEAAAALLNLIAMGVALWIAQRRGGLYALLGAAVVLTLLMRSYGGSWLTEAWNPYMPMMWWVVFLLAVWSVWCDDLALLPVAVFAGTLCAHTHLPYVGLVFGLGGLTAAMLAFRNRGALRDAATRRRLLLWGLPAVALLVLLWLPPVIDQLINDRGNLTLIKENFTRKTVVVDGTAVPVEYVGWSQAFKTVIANLSLDNVLFDQRRADTAAGDSYFNPFAFLALGAWAGAAVVAWRKRWSDLLNLHAMVGASLVLAVVAVSRIFDLLWYYLVLWLWGTLGVMLLATAWTYARAWQERRPAGSQPPRWAAAALVVALVGATGWATWDATSAEKHAAEESVSLGIVAREFVPRLESGDLPGGGKDGKYLVRWAWDSLSIGSQGFGFLLELDRQGFDVGVMKKMGTGAAHYREREPDEATATINYVVGERAIEEWRRVPGAVEATYYEPRNEAQLERFTELRAEVEELMADAGVTDAASRLDGNLFSTGISPATPKAASDKISQMMDLGLPIAVFVAPPESECYVNVPEDHRPTCVSG